MEETILDVALIKRKAISGVITLTLRTFFIQIFAFIATFILTILLDPSVFGVFFVVSAIINFFVYFSDIGLAAALIQKKENLTKEDLATTFIIQQVIISTIVVLALLFSFEIAKFYKLDASGLFLLRILIISLFLSSLKTIPSILLERKLDFTKLVIPQIFENIVFYSSAVILAYLNFGLYSFAWATLFRGFTGLVLIYVISPWLPNFSFSKKSASKLVSFGLPFQANSVLALIKDDLLTIFLGKILPFSQVGYLGWSQKWAFLPLRFFMDNINKVTFPTYSRLQDHKGELKKAIEKSISFVTFLVYPAVLGVCAIAPNVINVVPNYSKWQPALLPLYFFSINAMFSAVSTTFTNSLFAIGKPKIVLGLMVFWTVAIWGITLPLIMKYGYVGAAMASALVSASSIITIYFAKKEVEVSVFRNILGPLATSLVMFIFVKIILVVLPNNILSIILASICGAIIYLLTAKMFLGNQLLNDTKQILNIFAAKK